MAPYTLKILYSGSTGNAALLTAGDTAILIDAGRSARALSGALVAAGVSPDALSAIFITHEHRDHTAALEVFLKTHPVPVHIPEASAKKLLPHAPGLAPHLVPHPPISTVEIGPLTLTSFPTSHDSAASVGYRIKVHAADAVREIGYATDLGVVTPDVEEGLLGCETVVIECNHDEDMLLTGPYPHDLKMRIASRRGHLSNADCGVFCTRLATFGTNRFLLAHLSEINNLPELALGEVCAALAGLPVKVVAASPDTVTEI